METTSCRLWWHLMSVFIHAVQSSPLHSPVHAESRLYRDLTKGGHPHHQVMQHRWVNELYYKQHHLVRKCELWPLNFSTLWLACSSAGDDFNSVVYTGCGICIYVLCKVCVRHSSLAWADSTVRPRETSAKRRGPAFALTDGTPYASSKRTTINLRFQHYVFLFVNK